MASHKAVTFHSERKNYISARLFIARLNKNARQPPKIFLKKIVWVKNFWGSLVYKNIKFVNKKAFHIFLQFICSENY